MSETRRGAVILLQRGDPEISGAIAEGMLAARADTSSGAARHLPLQEKAFGEALEARQLPREQMEIVEAEIDRQHIVASLVRVAVGNDKTPEDYSLMVTKVRGDCARYRRAPGPVGRALRRLLGWYGLLCWAVAGVYHSQERLLGARR